MAKGGLDIEDARKMRDDILSSLPRNPLNSVPNGEHIFTNDIVATQNRVDLRVHNDFGGDIWAYRQIGPVGSGTCARRPPGPNLGHHYLQF